MVGPSWLLFNEKPPNRTGCLEDPYGTVNSLSSANPRSVSSRFIYLTSTALLESVFLGTNLLGGFEGNSKGHVCVSPNVSGFVLVEGTHFELLSRETNRQATLFRAPYTFPLNVTPPKPCSSSIGPKVMLETAPAWENENGSPVSMTTQLRFLSLFPRSSSREVRIRVSLFRSLYLVGEPSPKKERLKGTTGKPSFGPS